MSADLGADRNLSQNVSLRIQLQDSVLVPLAEVKVAAIVTEVGTRELRASYPFVLGKAAADNISADVSVIILTFAERKSQCVASGDSSPRNSGRRCFFRDCPRLHIDPINAPQIARSHPQRFIMPGERLRRRRRRRTTFSFSNRWKFSHSR